MFKNYLTVALRHLTRSKGYSTVNIVGLAVGLAACILIMLWVMDELSYDRFHANAGQLYRVTERFQEGDNVNISALTEVPLGPTLKAESSEILQATRFNIDGQKLIRFGDFSCEDDVVALADPDFLSMFSFPLVSGDVVTVLSDEMSVIVTESMSRKYFGDRNPMGQILNIDRRDFVVRGVMQDVPSNSHLQFDFLVPFESMPDWLKKITHSWTVSAFYTYVQTRPDVDLEALTRSCQEIVERHHQEVDIEVSYGLQPITRIHLYHDLEDYLEGHGDIKYVHLFMALAAVTLLIACINFMNISTARAGRRAREVGMRKVVGARRSSLVRQFLGESLFTSLLAMILALLLAELALPLMNAWSGKELTLRVANSGALYGYLIGLVMITGLTAGAYPAVYFSALRPVRVLKENLHSAGSGRRFRRFLVVTQFALAGCLLITTMIIYQQMGFIRTRNLGFDKDNMIYLTMRGDFQANYQTIKQQLLMHPGIAGVTAGRPPVRAFGSVVDLWWEGKVSESEAGWTSLATDTDYLETMGMTIVQGESFNVGSAESAGRRFVVNEAATKVMGIEDPVGIKFRFQRHNFSHGSLDKLPYEGTVVGVVKDFHYGSLHSGIDPVVAFVDLDQARWMSVRITPGFTSEVIALLRDYWSKYAPDHRFEYSFVDESVDNFYQSETNLTRILISFTILAALVSCLGLFGLASYLAEERTKEIGIRKTLGASVASVITMLCRESVGLVMIANVIVWPLAWYIVTRWLERFAYRIDIGPEPFVSASLLALILAMSSVGYQALKAARANPVEALRYE
jgi:putative ABC transport system permease protein